MNDAIAQLESIRSSVLSLFDERDAADRRPRTQIAGSDKDSDSGIYHMLVQAPR
jgi:hypothetical protein